MIIIIDTGPLEPIVSGDHVVLDGTFHVVARFEVLDRDEEGDVSVIRDVDQPSTDLRSHA